MLRSLRKLERSLIARWSKLKSKWGFSIRLLSLTSEDFTLFYSWFIINWNASMQSCELINNISGPHCLSYYLVLCDFYTLCQLTLNAVLYSVLTHISCCYNLCQFTIYTLCQFTLRAFSQSVSIHTSCVFTLCINLHFVSFTLCVNLHFVLFPAVSI